jgi:hypothetical protein
MLSVILKQGDQIGRFFANWATFGGSLCLNKQFQNMVCCRYFKVQKWFDVDVLGFQIKLVVHILAFWGLETVWATF